MPQFNKQENAMEILIIYHTIK